MPRAYGTDTLVEGAAGQFHLVCTTSKGWMARRERTPTTRSLPGTAVSWDGDWFEVLAAETLGRNAIRYTLAAWPDSEAIRHPSGYGEAFEAARGARAVEIRTDEARRRLLTLLAPLTGLLPCEVQERLTDRYGIPSLLPTYLSLIAPTLYGVACLHWWVRFMADGTPPPVSSVMLLAGSYALSESIIRLRITMSVNRPVGSAPGIIGHSLFDLWRRWRRGPDSEAELRARSQAMRGPGPDAARLLADRYKMLEPMLALLPEEDQRALQASFGFDPQLWGRRTATLLLTLCVLGAASDIAAITLGGRGIGSLASLVVAAILGIEQVLRLAALRSGPAGSMLGALVRPFAKPLLAPAAP